MLLLITLPRVLELNNVDVFVLDREKKTLQRNGCEIGTLAEAHGLRVLTRMGTGGKRQFRLTLAPDYGNDVLLAETSAIPDQEESNRYFFARPSFFYSSTLGDRQWGVYAGETNGFDVKDRGIFDLKNQIETFLCGGKESSSSSKAN